MEIRQICRERTGVFDPLFEDDGEDLDKASRDGGSSLSRDGGSSGLLGSMGVD